MKGTTRDLFQRQFGNKNEPRRSACGAVAHGKIYIVGGDEGQDCVLVYHETINEWQFKARLKMVNLLTCLCADEKHYLVKDFFGGDRNPNQAII